MLFAFAALLALQHVHAAHAGSYINVNTTSGTVQGLLNETTHVAQFLGIPFAEPPIGSRRWLPPSAKSRQNQTIDTTKVGFACPQFNNDVNIFPNVYTVDAPEFNTGPFDFQSEDCLTLSIWAPGNNTEYRGNASPSLPVIVWIYGGGFNNGGWNVPYQTPAPWVSRSQKHIVVSINYRLGIFGFPNSAALTTKNQNLGLLDQRLAIEWVRDNIANFGGDPKRITLWGQSAGSMSIDYYNFAYPDDPIATGLIMDSGTALLAFTNTDTLQTNFSFVAHQFNCGNSDPQQELECFRNVNSTSIINFMKSYSDNATQPSLAFVPIYDNLTDFSDYPARTAAGKFSKLPALIGTNKNEGVSFILPYNRTYGPNQTDARAATLEYFLCPTTQTARERYAANATTFRYMYSGNFSNISPQWWEGAYHASELPLVFGTYGIARGAGAEFEKNVSEKMQDLWLAFAQDPVNGLPKAGWEKYQNGKGDVMVFGDNGKVVQGVKESVIQAPCNGTSF